MYIIFIPIILLAQIIWGVFFMLPKGLVTFPNIVSILVALALLIIFMSVKKIKFATDIIVKIGIAVALSAVLNQITLYKMPQGGSITPGSMVPIVIISIIYGPQVGMLTGFLMGVIDLLLGGYVVHPAQILLDYPLAYMCIGLSGYIRPNLGKDAPSVIKIKLISGILIGFLARLACHVTTGIIFFAEYAKGKNPFIYSLGYNFSFLSIEFLITAFILSGFPLKQILGKNNTKNA